jgi:hypothetical protein
MKSNHNEMIFNNLLGGLFLLFLVISGIIDGTIAVWTIFVAGLLIFSLIYTNLKFAQPRHGSSDILYRSNLSTFDDLKDLLDHNQIEIRLRTNHTLDVTGTILKRESGVTKIVAVATDVNAVRTLTSVIEKYHDQYD